MVKAIFTSLDKAAIRGITCVIYHYQSSKSIENFYSLFKKDSFAFELQSLVRITMSKTEWDSFRNLFFKS
jgi:hypothetical protein